MDLGSASGNQDGSCGQRGRELQDGHVGERLGGQRERAAGSAAHGGAIGQVAAQALAVHLEAVDGCDALHVVAQHCHDVGLHPLQGHVCAASSSVSLPEVLLWSVNFVVDFPVHVRDRWHIHSRAGAPAAQK